MISRLAENRQPELDGEQCVAATSAQQRAGNQVGTVANAAAEEGEDRLHFIAVSIDLLRRLKFAGARGLVGGETQYETQCGVSLAEVESTVRRLSWRPAVLFFVF